MAPALPIQVLEGGVPDAVISELEQDMMQDEHEAEQDDEAASGGEAEAEMMEDEMQNLQAEHEKALHDACELEGGSEDDGKELVWADSDDDIKDFKLVSKSVSKVKTFCYRPAFQALDELELTSLPRHITGCSLSYHEKERRWQGLYPNVKLGMNFSWGGRTKKTEKECILQVVQAVLQAHCDAHPKDKLWAVQLSKVKNAIATHSF